MKRLLLFICILFAGYAAFAETITGKVTNRQGEAMPFVTVSVLSLYSTLVTGAITDENGRYSVEVGYSSLKDTSPKEQGSGYRRHNSYWSATKN